MLNHPSVEASLLPSSTSSARAASRAGAFGDAAFDGILLQRAGGEKHAGNVACGKGGASGGVGKTRPVPGCGDTAGACTFRGGREVGAARERVLSGVGGGVQGSVAVEETDAAYAATVSGVAGDDVDTADEDDERTCCHDRNELVGMSGQPGEVAANPRNVFILRQMGAQSSRACFEVAATRGRAANRCHAVMLKFLVSKHFWVSASLSVGGSGSVMWFLSFLSLKRYMGGGDGVVAENTCRRHECGTFFARACAD